MKIKYIVLIGVIAVSGCSSIKDEGALPAISIDSEMAPYAKAQFDTVVILDRSLQALNGKGKVTVERSHFSINDNGLAQVVVQVRNRLKENLQLEARSTFFNRNKLISEPQSGWQRMYLEPNSIAQISFTSINDIDIEHYLVEIREGR